MGDAKYVREASRLTESLAAWEREAAGIDEYVPLAAYPALLLELCPLSSCVADSVYIAGQHAASEAQDKPGRGGQAPGELDTAAKRAYTASDSLGTALDAVRRALRKGKDEEDQGTVPHWRHAAIARQCAGFLTNSLGEAGRAGTVTLDGLVALTRLQEAALWSLAKSCDPVGRYLFDAYDRMPGAIAITQDKARRPVLRAAQKLTRAAILTSQGHGSLAIDQGNARRAAAAGR